jgi:hypothetical protein
MQEGRKAKTYPPEKKLNCKSRKRKEIQLRKAVNDDAPVNLLFFTFLVKFEVSDFIQLITLIFLTINITKNFLFTFALCFFEILIIC